MQWPDSLVRDIARRRAVIVLGAGISRQATNANDDRPPTWKSFLETALAECPNGQPDHIREAIDTGDYLHACEWLKNLYDEDWVRYLRSVFAAPQFEPAKIHEHILELDNRIIYSFNFDTIYERCSQAMKQGSHVIKQYHDRDASEYLRGDGRYIVKVHGSVDAPDKLIFNQKDYAEARVKYRSFYDSFDAALLTHTFLFLGAGYSDPDVNLVLENQAFSVPTASPHYIVRPQGDHDDLKRSLRANRNLKTLEYDPIDDEHSGLVLAVSDLKKLVEDARIDIQQDINW